MSFYIVCCILSVILLLLSIFYYVLRSREIKLNIIGHLRSLILTLKFTILPLSFLLFANLFLRTEYFTYTPENLITSSFVFISMMCIISSILIFIYSFQLSPKYEIKLDKPSRLKSRRGTINLGKIFSKNKAKYKFFLDISDLAQHMFVCGITGTGKSNFIQYFLLNFAKHHDLPFLLTEFKGE